MRKIFVLFFGIIIFIFSKGWTLEISVGFTYNKDLLLIKNLAYRKTFLQIMEKMKNEVGFDYANSIKKSGNCFKDNC